MNKQQVFDVLADFYGILNSPKKVKWSFFLSVFRVVSSQIL